MMISVYFDTVIIGGGPAGSSCALTLQHHGLTSCVIDRQRFPRHKLCAGLLTVKTRQLLGRLLPDISKEEFMSATDCSVAPTFKLFDKKEPVISVDIKPSILMTERYRFDNYLLNAYKGHGGTVFEGKAVSDIDFARRIVRLEDGSEIRYNHLVAADGANSLTSRMSRKMRPGNALCAETEISSADLRTGGVCAYFNIVPKSYAWTFKKGDHVSVGMIKLKGMNFDLKATFRKFLKFLGVNPANYPIKGALLPMSNFKEKPTYHESVLFVGDAGGFVDPLTGEGIYFALRSGMLAAESLLQPAPCVTYQQELRPVIKKLKSDEKFAHLLYTPAFLRRFCKDLYKYERFVRHFYATHIDGFNADGVVTTYMKYKWCLASKNDALQSL
ncbi:MAG: geranylgeranyl reductase family protein [Prevotella sp.]|nr:geranylgeranyl reductase family protein [Prevotella sp.]MCI1684718.1 geranylgeranyl reductase family protein [Prevotella sp.]MCI1780373.1 geranylgeranyl reductase family protein [Prevotella sp.]MCI1801760.1 geranylgeranyl reductase family protein [Prevotella sp.]MCI1816808.1 geranylgeranyl reductase family protein [Prevotella sp.]MCI2136726.1 geranylgeranyl reductase family protein [Prevotella sp.]